MQKHFDKQPPPVPFLAHRQIISIAFVSPLAFPGVSSKVEEKQILLLPFIPFQTIEPIEDISLSSNLHSFDSYEKA